jgi:hypothetical protein
MWVQDMPGWISGHLYRAVKNRAYPVLATRKPSRRLPGPPAVGCGDFSHTIYHVAVPPLPAGEIGDLVFTHPGFSQPGAHRLWAAIDTGCQVEETDETNNTLGPVQVDVLKYLIFKDGFESGDTSAWSSCQRGGGDLAVTPVAAMTGSYGLALRLDNKAPRACTAKHAQAEAQVQARFRLDPNSLGMAQGDAFTVFQGLQGGRAILQVEPAGMQATTARSSRVGERQSLAVRAVDLYSGWATGGRILLAGSNRPAG